MKNLTKKILVTTATERTSAVAKRTSAATVAKRIFAVTAKLIAILLAFTLIVGSLSGCGILLGRWLFGGPSEDGPNDPDIIHIPDNVEYRPLHDIADELFAYLVSSDFSTYHQLIANPANFNIPVPEPTFGDISIETTLKEFEYLRTLYYQVLIHDLPDYYPAGISDDERRLYEYLCYFLETYLKLEPYVYFFDPYEPSSGEHASLPLTLLTFSFNTKQDIDYYLALVADIPRVFEQANAIVQERTEQGIFPNRAALESSIEEAETYTVRVAENLLVTSFEDALYSNVEPFVSLTQDERTHYANTNRILVEALVIPAYKNVITILQNLVTKTSYNLTLASYPAGHNYYAAQFSLYGFAETPDEAIVTLDKALDDYIRILTNGAAILDYDTRDRIAVRNIPTDAADIISYFNSRVAEDFPDIGTRPFVVDSASDNEVVMMFTAFYLLAPVDDLTVNRIKYYSQNLDGLYDLASTLSHEAFPGHLYQYNYFGLTQQPHPIEMLLGMTAYQEGYAVYSQYYALNYMGFSKEQALAINTYELYLRALQARLDLGINYEGWNLRKTQAFLSGFGLGGYAEELFREIASAPLLMLPYGLGPIEFFKMLDAAQLKLGSKFDLIEFHTVILKDGAVPFAILEENVNAWLNGL